MSNELKLETLQDLLTIDTNGQKANDNKAILARVKQLIKAETKQENNADETAKDFPYKGVAVVGNKLVELNFDLENKSARVMDVKIDSRDARGRNYMAVSMAISMIEKMGKKQKEILGE